MAIGLVSAVDLVVMSLSRPLSHIGGVAFHDHHRLIIILSSQHMLIINLRLFSPIVQCLLVTSTLVLVPGCGQGRSKSPFFLISLLVLQGDSSPRSKELSPPSTYLLPFNYETVILPFAER